MEWKRRTRMRRRRRKRRRMKEGEKRRQKYIPAEPEKPVMNFSLASRGAMYSL